MKEDLILKKVDESNFIECFNLMLAGGQEKFVSHPIRSLAQGLAKNNKAIFTSIFVIGLLIVIYRLL